ncbi:DUF5316 domain-containing protein [Fredinandcohnia sp. SECRCQ15]|uniref:DUF5316 domain-containing protein n=2 Tax=Fredinandcohnia quinoae TaxID=2918902 RepID=A0AAW5E8Z4_9BACI|nr:DUF5316 domain-containing protein [Fredinandcohnia sp. SECRCQ15]
MGLSTQEYEQYSVISGISGIVFLLIAGILSGSFISGDRIRANFATETKSDRLMRNRWLFIFSLIGAPNLIVALLLTIKYL